MDRLETLRIFAAVAEGQSFAAAARRLRLSPPAVTRAVAALEARLGTRLLHRTTRIVRVTEAGRGLLADARRILADLDEAEAAASGTAAAPTGLLSLTAPASFGRMFVAPIALDFLAAHPRLDLRLLLIDRVVDLIDEGIDVGVRIAVLPDSALSAIRVGGMRSVICGAPGYLKARGTPRTPDEIAGHDTIAFAGSPGLQEWSLQSGTRRIAVKTRPRLTVNTAEVAVAAAAAGHGLVRVLSYQAAEAVRQKRLRIVLDRFEPPPAPVSLVHLEGRRAPAKVRAFLDFAAPRLRAAAGAW